MKPDLHCLRCDVTYAQTQYHCCRCHRVFRTAGTFEKHWRPGRCLTDKQLVARGLEAVDGVWKRVPPEAYPGMRKRGVEVAVAG